MKKMYADFKDFQNFEGHWFYPSRRRESETELLVLTKEELHKLIKDTFEASRVLLLKKHQDPGGSVISYKVPKYLSWLDYIKEICL